MLLKTEIPNTLYHITKCEFLPGILSQGLIPNKEKNARFFTEEDDEKRVGVYLCSDWELLIQIDSAFRDDKYALLAVDVSAIKDLLTVDEAYDPETEETYPVIAWICQKQSFLNTSSISVISPELWI